MQRHAHEVIRSVAVVGLSLVLATVAVEMLEHNLGVANASSLYLVAVVLSALLVGTGGAIAVAAGAFLVYNFLFTDPRFTFAIHDPGVLLSVLLLLFVGIVVGQLAALQRGRAEAAGAREREARAMFGVSRSLATRDSTAAALAQIAAVLQTETGMERVWVAIGPDPATEHVAADTGDGQPPPPPTRLRVLQRTPGDEPARWVRVQRPGAPAATRTATGLDPYRVRIEASGEPLGSVWALRDRSRDEPDPTATRLLAAAADQIGQALTHDRVEERTRAAEVAQQSDALKSALLQSVSHDLRTPLATIRAAAGSLRPGVPMSEDDRQASADAIEREVEYLNRLVTNLLDLSRIEAGALRARRDVFELDDGLARAIESIRPRLGGRTLAVDLSAPPVEVDPVFLDEAFANVLDNALKHTPTGTFLRVSAGETADGRVRVTVEDDGPGVADEIRPRLFDKFYRAPGAAGGSRGGTGIGLAVARGLIEATGGRVDARRSELGGLAIDLDLPIASVPEELAAGRST
jgi:two-component system, OmpR family, sensor histidine kinase KdpD